MQIGRFKLRNQKTALKEIFRNLYQNLLSASKKRDAFISQKCRNSYF
ncbi:hypothetical protein LEP1GSC008_2577 [Leptospira kirschneri serovar Bulgarica str. Nikolaevo]|uniref:Uncharacterized protein n=1 Tax=Leptospira kirschneri serovar Bulgarica str. Nikolaevo TaxID=1240687 RepID=M6EYF7_9LEPT|nr:hypothetical protein LEP1GSC008_2577 [Leptospira kirschneri serovar Bulgarica str. Nikolaevo]